MPFWQVLDSARDRAAVGQFGRGRLFGHGDNAKFFSIVTTVQAES